MRAPSKSRKHFIRKDFRLAITCSPEDLDEAIVLSLLVGFDHRPGGMAGIEFHGGIGEGAPAFELVGENVLDVIDPSGEFFLGRAPSFAKQVIENFDIFVRKLLDIGDDEVILRAKVPVERHLVRQRGFSDRLDPDRVHAKSIEKLAGCNDDPLARWLPRESRVDFGAQLTEIAQLLDLRCTHRPLTKKLAAASCMLPIGN